jgi:hypothetical protein
MASHLIAFRDFRGAGPDGLDVALVATNEWLARTGIQPLNVETIVEMRGGMMSRPAQSSDRGIRVWYEVGSM